MIKMIRGRGRGLKYADLEPRSALASNSQTMTGCLMSVLVSCLVLRWVLLVLKMMEVTSSWKEGQWREEQGHMEPNTQLQKLICTTY